MGLRYILCLLLLVVVTAQMPPSYQPPLLLPPAARAPQKAPYQLPLESGRTFHQSSSILLQALPSKVEHSAAQSIQRAPASEIEAIKLPGAIEKDAPKNDEYVVYYYYYYDNDTATNGSTNLNLNFDDIPSLEGYDDKPAIAANSLSEPKPETLSAQPRSVSGGVDRPKEVETVKPVSNVFRYASNEVPRFPVLPHFVVSEAPSTNAPVPLPEATSPTPEVFAATLSVSERPDDELNSVLDNVPAHKPSAPVEIATDNPTTTEEPTTTTEEPTTTTEKSRRRPSIGGRRRFSPSPAAANSFSSNRNRNSTSSRSSSTSTTSTTTASSVSSTRRSFGGNRVRPRPSPSANRPRPESTTSSSTTITTPRARFSTSPTPSRGRFQSSRSRVTSAPISSSSTTSRPAPPPRAPSNRPRPNIISRNRPPRPGFPRSRPEPEEPPTTLPPTTPEEPSPDPVEEEELSEEEEEATSSEEEEDEPTTTEASRFSALFRPRNRNALGNRPRPAIGNRPVRS